MANSYPKPLGCTVLLRLDPLEEKIGNILIVRDTPTEQQIAQSIGTVIELGQTAYNIHLDNEPWVKPGDKVFFKKYEGTSYHLKNFPGNSPDSDIIVRIVEDAHIVGLIDSPSEDVNKILDPKRDEVK